MNDKHFEHLWEEAELVSSKVSKQSKEEVIQSILALLEEYKAIENEATRLRKFGEILFKLSELSLKDNINVYNALLLNIKYFNIALNDK
jgi:hypothetical protein